MNEARERQRVKWQNDYSGTIQFDEWLAFRLEAAERERQFQSDERERYMGWYYDTVKQRNNAEAQRDEAVKLLDEWRRWWQSGPVPILQDQRPVLWANGGEIQDNTCVFLATVGEKP